MLHIPAWLPTNAKRLVNASKLYRDLEPFEGNWEAFELTGRDIGQKMEGAFLTTITKKHLWPFAPRVLDVHAQDWDSHHNRVRRHYGHITLDPNIPTQGTRTLSYEDSLEVMHARVEFGSDPDVLIVTPIEQGYKKHVLRRTRRLLDC